MADLIESTIGWGWFMVIAMTSPFWLAFSGFLVSQWRHRRKLRLRLHTLSRKEFEEYQEIELARGRDRRA
jgi:hypothetical protein